MAKCKNYPFPPAIIIRILLLCLSMITQKSKLIVTATARPSAALSMARARAVSGWTKWAALEMNRVWRIARTTDGDHTTAATERTQGLFAVSNYCWL